MPEMPKDAADLFDNLIPKGIQAYPDKAKEVGAIYGFKVTGDGGGEWTVNLKADPPTCERGDNGTAECTLEVTSEDFAAMLADPQQAMQLYFQGKLKVSGDPMLAMKLQSFLDLARA